MPVVYRHNRRAKRLSMRMSADYQSVAITIPLICSRNDVERFLEKCAGWLLKRIDNWAFRRLDKFCFKEGSNLSIFGQPTKILWGDFEKITLKDDTLSIPQKIDHPRIIQGFLNERLFEYVCYKSKIYAAKLNVDISKIHIKPLKASYGICSSKKTISYASRLVFASRDVIDYVCAHEVAHLIEMNHSAAFWKIVKELMPDYETHKAWLKMYGYTLRQCESSAESA